eukprot:gene13984-22252_t
MREQSDGYRMQTGELREKKLLYRVFKGIDIEARRATARRAAAPRDLRAYA